LLGFAVAVFRRSQCGGGRTANEPFCGRCTQSSGTGARRAGKTRRTKRQVARKALIWRSANEVRS
jgi:hypothetical protein